jgi:hypothetical protein
MNNENWEEVIEEDRREEEEEALYSSTVDYPVSTSSFQKTTHEEERSYWQDN